MLLSTLPSSPSLSGFGSSYLSVGTFQPASFVPKYQTILLAPLTVEPPATTEPTPAPTSEPTATVEPTPSEPTPTATSTETAAPVPTEVILDADQFGAIILGFALVVSFSAVSMVRGFRR